MDDLLEAPAEREVVREALERRVGELVHARERGPAEVALDDEDATSLLRHHAGERERARGLALGRGRAGHDDAGERLLGREEGDVRPQDAEGLQEALLAASREPAPRDARHAREHRHVQLAGEVVLAAQARVDAVAQKREAGAEEEREDEHDRRVERRPRPHGRGRRLRAVGHGDLPVRLRRQLVVGVLGERLRVGVGEVGRLLGAVALRGDHE